MCLKEKHTFKNQIDLGKLPYVVFLSQAHLVAAFEKSLGNMTGRLQSLTMTAEQKVGLSKRMLYFRK